MLRVDIHNSANALILKLEGRFTGDDAETLARSWRAAMTE